MLSHGLFRMGRKAPPAIRIACFGIFSDTRWCSDAQMRFSYFSDIQVSAAKLLAESIKEEEEVWPTEWW